MHHDENDDDQMQRLLAPQEDADRKKKLAVDRNQCNPIYVLATVGRSSRDGRLRSEYVHRNKPHWVRTWCRIKVPVWHPEAEVRMVWSLVGFIFIVFEAFLIPFYMAFSYKPEGTMFVAVSVVNTYFIVDIFWSFFTGYND